MTLSKISMLFELFFVFIFLFGCMRGISLNQTNSRDGQAAWLRSQCPKVSHKHSCQNWHTIFISAHTFACVSFVQLMVRLGIKSVFWQADSGALKLLSIHYFFFGVKSQVYWASNTFCPYTEKGQKRQWFFAAIHDFLFNNAKHLLLLQMTPGINGTATLYACKKNNGLSL